MGADRTNEYPEIVSFEGVGNASLVQINIIAVSVIILGVIFAILSPPGGYVALILLILLRTNPVEASYGERKIGEIKGGTLVVDMENPNELGYRPAPNKRIAVWKFDSEKDAKIVAKRLLEYLSKED